MEIGNGVMVAAAYLINPFATIGKDIIIGVGAVVIKDITEAGVYVGSPAKKLERK